LLILLYVPFLLTQYHEAQTQYQGLSAVLIEKNRQIEDLRRQIERNMSQNRLAAYRSDAADRKKKRSSY
jgi:hypothetical protein